MYNIRPNAQFNIKVTMIIKKRSKIAYVFYSVRIIVFPIRISAMGCNGPYA